MDMYRKGRDCVKVEVISHMISVPKTRSRKKRQLVENFIVDVKSWCEMAGRLWGSLYKKKAEFVVSFCAPAGDGYIVGVSFSDDTQSNLFYFSNELGGRRLLFFLTKNEMVACVPVIEPEERKDGGECVLTDEVSPQAIPVAMVHYGFLWLGGANKISRAYEGLRTLHFRLFPPSHSEWTFALRPKLFERRPHYVLKINLDATRQGGSGVFYLTDMMEGLLCDPVSMEFRTLSELRRIFDFFLLYPSMHNL